MKNFCPATALAIVIAFPIGASALPLTRWFPLDPGNAWTYTPETIGGKKTVQVLFRDGDLVYVALGSVFVRLGGTTDAIDIDLPGEGLVPYYRFSEKSFVHRDLSGCDDGAKVSAAPDLETVETPRWDLRRLPPARL
jgi:hypothetical protein